MLTKRSALVRDDISDRAVSPRVWSPGRVITYERNYVTNDLLAKHGLDVLTVPSAELSRGRGGPRCMSCPVNRDDL